MQAVRYKQAVAVCGANTINKAVSPAVNDRVYLLIQNTGANPGQVQFKDPIKQDGSALLFAAGAGLIWDRPETCPTDAITCFSTLGTTFAIMEGVRANG